MARQRMNATIDQMMPSVNAVEKAFFTDPDTAFVFQLTMPDTAFGGLVNIFLTPFLVPMTIEADPSGPFAATAQLGVAASLEAQNKPDLAAPAYQRVLSVFPGSPFVAQAEFGLGRIAEQQNKLSDAVSYYQKVTTETMGGTLGQEAALRASELKVKLAAAAPKPATAALPGATPKSGVPPQPAVGP